MVTLRPAGERALGADAWQGQSSIRVTPRALATPSTSPGSLDLDGGGFVAMIDVSRELP